MNEFLTTKEIARQALPILESNLVFPALVYRDYSDTFSKKGDTIQVRKPPIYNADEFQDEIAVQDVKEGEVLVTLDKIADVSVELSAKEMALDIENFTRQVVEPAMVAIAEKINADGHALYADVPYVSGTAGETPSELADIAGAVKVLNDHLAPLSGRSAVWSTEAIANFQVLPALVNAEKAGSTQALREGSIGRVFGVDNYLSQQVKTHPKNGLTVSGALTVSAATAGKNEVTIKAATSCTGTLERGNLLTIGAGTYTVTTAGEASQNAVTVTVYPALAEDVKVGTAVQIAEPHRANLVFQKNAFGFVSRPLEAARGADSYVTAYNGLSLRVTMDYNITTKKQTLSIDTLYGYKTLYPELAVRVLG